MTSLYCLIHGHEWNEVFNNRRTDGYKIDGQMKVIRCENYRVIHIDDNCYLLDG